MYFAGHDYADGVFATLSMNVIIHSDWISNRTKGTSAKSWHDILQHTRYSEAGLGIRWQLQEQKLQHVGLHLH